jgi:hypothetical protein
MNGKRIGVVEKAYERVYDDPITMVAGEAIEATERTDDWNGHLWVWCVNSRGKGGWVPDSFIQTTNGGSIARYDYSAMELTASEGESVAILQETHGWYWCTNVEGVSGWIPVENVGVIA